MKKIIYSFLWSVIDIFERIYWRVKNEHIRNGLMSCGQNVSIGRFCDLFASNISIGNDVFIGDGCRFHATRSHILIGDKVMFGPGVEIHGGNHRFDIVGKYMYDIGLEDKRQCDDQDVIIDKDCWIGAGAIILKGVHIHEGCVIGAGTIVAKDTPPIRLYLEQNNIARSLASLKKT